MSHKINFIWSEFIFQLLIFLVAFLSITFLHIFGIWFVGSFWVGSLIFVLFCFALLFFVIFVSPCLVFFWWSTPATPIQRQVWLWPSESPLQGGSSGAAELGREQGSWFICGLGLRGLELQPLGWTSALHESLLEFFSSASYSRGALGSPVPLLYGAGFVLAASAGSRPRAQQGCGSSLTYCFAFLFCWMF